MIAQLSCINHLLNMFVSLKTYDQCLYSFLQIKHTGELKYKVVTMRHDFCSTQLTRTYNSGYTIKLLDKFLPYLYCTCNHLHLLKQINFNPSRISVSQLLICLHLIHNYTYGISYTFQQVPFKRSVSLYHT